MDTQSNLTRRDMLKSGIAAATSAIAAPTILAAPKNPKETKVLFLVGDVWHNGVRMESHWRRVLSVTGWRLMFAQSSQFVTPELLDEIDLFIFARYAGGDSLGWSPEGIIEERPKSYYFMTGEQEDAMVRNVTERGMGLIPFHCSMWQPKARKFLDLVGMQEPKMHGPLMETSFYDINQSHPLTQGIEEYTTEDEIFGAVMQDVDYTPLMRARQELENGEVLDRLAAWSREAGKGRIVFLNCGASHVCYWKKSFKELMWRSAFWSMGRDIPVSGLIEGRHQDRES